MEKKTVEALRVMICGELDDVAKQGQLTHESLDVLKDLLESLKALEKLEKMEREKEEMEMGYSQRSMGRYYVDGEYGDGRSFRQGQSRMNYERGRSNYDGGNSYGYYEPRYNYMPYSRGGEKHEVIEKLQEMMQETNDEMVRNTISEALNKIK